MLTGKPWVCVGIDLTEPHPTSTSGNKYIVTLIDHFTQWVEISPARSRSGNRREDLGRPGLLRPWNTDPDLDRPRREFREQTVPGELFQWAAAPTRHRQSPDHSAQAISEW